MKKVNMNPASVLLKAIDLELKAILKKDLKAFRAKQNGKLAA